MKHPEFNSYCFKHLVHWRAGAIDNLQSTDDSGLNVLAGFDVEPIANTGPEDETPALDFGPCDHLYWVRVDTRELVRLHTFGPQTVGTLSEAEGATKLAVGAERLWLLTPRGINNYALHGLHPLRQLKPQRPILDMAGDGCDGVWWLEGGNDKEAELFHADRYGCLVATPIPLKIPLNRAALDVTGCGRKIVILDPQPPASDRVNEPCKGEKAHWRLIVVDCVDAESLIYDDIGLIDGAFKPVLLTIDNAQQIHLFGPHKAQVQLWTLNIEGALIAQRQPRLPQDGLPVSAMSAGHYITLATAAGIVHLRPADITTSQGEERRSTFITPTLISPDGTPRGWQRAEIEIVLPEGTTLEVTCAATRDPNLVRAINRILGDNRHTPAFKVDQLNERLAWRAEDRVIYAGSDVDDGAAHLSYLLHQVDHTHLWLRFRFYTPPGRRPPALKALTVFYPNLSYLRYLPAVYQEDQASAAGLRRFLAIYETLFGDLDAAIDQLPSHIDPNTAPVNWLSFLLRWLGLPSPDGLSPAVQRNLLKEAPKLLAQRGTVKALQRLLEIITAANGDISIQINDLAAGPPPWVLQPLKRSAIAPKLGYDTLIVSRQPSAFRLGAARLGSSKGVPLGIGRTDSQRVFAHRTGELRLRVGATGEISERLEPIIKIFLPYFVPAHCRYRLEFAPSAPQPWHQRLDVDLRLMDGAVSRLGSETIAGRFRLPLLPTDEIILDRSARLDRGLHLN